ncbi:penicillin-binding protein [Ktedonospora formicarum]|uniref:Penicillin-binding protein n=2 Tax=Ktedonospora formicarum TaxID=2778364 RepID=A0A8J3MP70_9CHLR|nr:penicillin-binding protein [Ktedonospora formicarum]
MQFMKQVSGKMTALGRNRYAQPEPPMSLYHPQRSQNPLPTTQDLPQLETPWKRSLSTRVAYKMRRRRDRWQRSKFGIGRIAGIAAIILATIGLIGGSLGGLYSYNYYQQQSTQVSGIANMANPQTTRIYDRNNQLVAERYDNQNAGSKGRLTPVSYKDIPEILQQAQVAAEDRSFWDNAGIDPQGILRAFSSGNGGGSTITQQVIKNLSGQDQGTYTRKLVEATLALGMTQQYPKWKILEMYFNSVPYGTQDLGVESAVRDYFGLQPTCDKNFKCTPAVAKLNIDPKTHKENPLVGLARASLLASVPNNPTLFDPTVSETTLAKVLERQKYVLGQMKAVGITVGGKPLDDEMIQQAEKLTASWKFKPYTPVKKAPHFVDWVTLQVIQMLGHGDDQLGARLFLTGGFNIRTTIDSNLQKYVENASKYFITQPTYQKFGSYAGSYATVNKDLNLNDAAVVVIDSKTGEVLAMSGSIDYYNPSGSKKVGGNVNVATSVRGPGSTFKPIVYATAFQMGWNPGIILPDIRTYFPNGNSAGLLNTAEGNYSPTDYGGKPNEIAGPQATIRESVANSFNIPAVKAMTYAGLPNVFNNARMMGITSIDSDMQKRGCDRDKPLTCYGLTPVLGTVDITPLEMTSAYQTFANDGVHMPYQNILDVWDNYGHNLFHQDVSKVKGTRVFSSQVNYLMTSVLADEPSRQREFPGDHDLSFYDWDPSCPSSVKTYISCSTYQVGAKTGTTDSFKDNWTIGYTPRATVGVWAGNANGSNMAEGVVGITGAAPIWHAVMEFVSGRPCADINAAMQTQISCPISRFDPKKAGMTSPTTFTQPSGVSRVCTMSATDGLAGSGICDWVIDGQSPTVPGVTTPTVPPSTTTNNNGNGNGNMNQNSDQGIGNPQDVNGDPPSPVEGLPPSDDGTPIP